MSKVHVLLVEDNLFATRVTKITLGKMDCEVDSSLDGESAVKMAQKTTYDLILMDIGLPGISGVQACEAIRKNEKNAGKPPVLMVAVTANADPEQGELCKKAGMQDVVVKPLTDEKAVQILSMLNRIS